jgi:hypothetical protein
VSPSGLRSVQLAPVSEDVQILPLEQIAIIFEPSESQATDLQTLSKFPAG